MEKMRADSLVALTAMCMPVRREQTALSLGYVTSLITYVIILIGTGATPDS